MDKDYYKNYYRNNYRKFKPGVGIREICIIKKVSRVTVYKNLHRFDRIENIKSLRFYFNDKILNWFPRGKNV